MFARIDKSIALLQKQLNKYLKVPISDKLIPLIGFVSYIFLVPQILFRIIPFRISQNQQYLSLQTQQTIIYIICLVLGNLLTVFGYSAFIYFVYNKFINMQKYRVSPNKLWPWEQNYNAWKSLFNKTVKTILINNLCFGFLVLSIWASILQRKVLFSHQMPQYTTILWQLMLFLVIQDMSSTSTHTLLHSKQLYWIHKKHHEYTTTVSIAAQYAHPIQFIISNSIPTVIGFKLLAYATQVNVITAVTWLIYRILLTSDLHSGYQFPWDFYKLLPFTAPAAYHDYHHSHNIGNFASSFMFIQALNGNNQQYFKYINKKAQQNKLKQVN